MTEFIVDGEYLTNVSTPQSSFELIDIDIVDLID